VAPRVSTTMQVIQTDGLASGSNPITKVKGAQTITSQSFCAFNTKEERTLLARGEETTTPQVVRASNFRVLGIHDGSQSSIDKRPIPPKEIRSQV
jgi:hypothetical protein